MEPSEPQNPPAPQDTQTDMPVHRAEDLVGPDGRALIRFGTQTYLLRITRNHKLILTK